MPKIIAVFLLLLGCSPQVSLTSNDNPQAVLTQEVRTDAVPLQSTSAGHYLYRRHSLCENLAKFDGGAGLFQVVSMVSHLEKPNDVDRLMPYTYVTLKLIDSWASETPANLTVRMRGGQTPGESTAITTVDLTVGENVGLALFAPTAYNKGYYAVHPLGVFRAGKDGVFGTEMHPIGKSFADVKAKIAQTLGKSKSDCAPFDVIPQDPPKEVSRPTRSLGVNVPLQDVPENTN
jgi:hypothetical protein